MNDRYLHIMMAKGQQMWKDKHLSDARAIFEDLAGQFPAEADLFHCLGSVALEQGDSLSAERFFCKLVDLRPDSTEAKMLLGMTCAEIGRHQLAVDYLQLVAEEIPGVTEVYHRLGLSLAELQRYPEALKWYQEALKTSPGHSGILCSIGLLFSSTGRLTESQQYLTKSLDIDPDNLGAMNNLGRVLKMRGRSSEGLRWFEKVLERDPNNGPATSNFLYTLNYVEGVSPDRIAAAYRELAPRAFPPAGKGCTPPATPLRLPSRPFRIGYVSADFYGHSVAFFLEPVLANHDPEEFEIFCYSNRIAGDQTTERLRALAKGWRQISGVPDHHVAAMIVEDGIDVLVDLSGHTAGHRLGVFACRPAAVQASWIGHPNTTGLPQMGYYITDGLCAPQGADSLFMEKLWRLPRIFSCYRPPVESPEASPPPASTKGFITFGCFNNFAKVNHTLADWWAEILREVPGSRLFLKNQSMNDAETRSEVLGILAHHGIEPDRVTLQGVTRTREEHFQLYSQIDIALDTFPYHGTTTTCEALWMGVPVVTLAGTTHVSRVGVSLLHAVGLDDLVAATPGEYVSRAASLAGNSSRLAWLRSNLRLVMERSPLMDAAGVTREVEDAFRGMIRRRLREVAEASFLSGNHAHAEACYCHLISDSPGDAALQNSLATVLDAQNRYGEAVAHYYKALALEPGSPDIRCNIANTLGRSGATGEAIVQLEYLVEKNPDFARGWQTLGHYLLQEGRQEEAVDCLKRVVELATDKVEALRDLADLYEEGRQFAKALACREQALSHLPDDVNLLNSVGLMKHELGDLDGAETAYHAALALDPDNPVLHNNMGNICKSRLMYPEAIASYDRALASDGDNASVIFNRALACLALGNFQEGWRGFERRFDMIPPVVLPHRHLPEWAGEPLNGRRLLVQSEQVFGDTFMFCRFVRLASSCGGPVVFQCQDRNVRAALSSLEPCLEALLVRGEPLPPVDLQIPLLSLPRIFGTSLESIPLPEGYLTPHPQRFAFWSEIITESQDGLKVGLVWGGRKAPLNSDRSLRLDVLEPLLRLSGIRYYSLQTGDEAREAAEYAGIVSDLNPLLTDFGETAAAIANLDLVITIDTAVAHLAGALGKPVWVLLKYSPDWRWLLDRSDSPWYSSARLFRQLSRGDWSAPVSAMVTTLRDLSYRKKTAKETNSPADNCIQATRRPHIT